MIALTTASAAPPPHFHPPSSSSSSSPSPSSSPPLSSSLAADSAAKHPQLDISHASSSSRLAASDDSPGRMLAAPSPSTTSSISTASSRPSMSSKRPKLSLQTSCLPVAFGKSTTALSFNLNASCTSSPTVRNTFNNAYDNFRGSVASTTASPLSKQPPSLNLRGASPFVCNNAAKNINDDNVPYQLPLGVRGILRNSPVPDSALHRSSSVSTPSGRRKLFPAKKRVSYRHPLEEEITTVRFVARHSDLLSTEPLPPVASDADFLSLSSEEEDSDSSLSTTQSGSSPSYSDAAKSSPSDDSEAIHTTPTTRRKRKYQRSERQVLAAGLRDGLIGASSDLETPKTPVQRRSKRPRQWRWTLGPVKDGHVQEASGLDASSSTRIADDDLPPMTPVVAPGCGPLSRTAITINTTVDSNFPPESPRPREAPLSGSAIC